MRSVQTNELAHCSIAGGAPAGVAANGTVSGVSSRGLVIPHPSSWVAFAPRELPRFLTTTHPLTPGTAASVVRWLFEAPTVRGSLTSILRPGLRASELHPDRAGLFVSWLKSSRHSVSTHLSPPSEIGLVLSPRLTAWTAQSTSAAKRTIASWASPLASRLAAATGRIEFVILRTGSSPPVAPHPALRDAVTFRYKACTQL